MIENASSDPPNITVEEADLRAPSYALLLAEMSCWKCGQPTPVSALWLPSHTEVDHEAGEDEVCRDEAVLQYVGALSAAVWEHWKLIAPWMGYAHTDGAGTNYLANHCVACGTVQGDWFVFGVDGPFFPQTDADLGKIQFIPGRGKFFGCASMGFSSWMSEVGKGVQ
jgi:hypothetical protein